MRKQVAHQTLLTLVAWLLLQNFNLSALNPVSGHEHRCEVTVSRSGGGKSTDSHCTANHSGGKVCAGIEYRQLSAALRKTTGGAYRIRKIVLDAGHGGKDPGCIGASSKEKHNALAIVLKLGALIRAEFPDVEVIYTRETDVFVELNERAAIANRNNADLFVSVHCNAVSASRIHGAETYVMGLHTAQHNLEVAKRENASIFLEDNYQKNYGGYDPNSPEAHIFGSVMQSAYLEQSILFAGFVQQYAAEIAGREDKGVKQAGFLVLRETAMPSVLVEAGYLTNRVEEAFIASAEGQEQMAEAIFEAFRAYKAQMEGMPFVARAVKPVPAQMTAKSGQAVPAGNKTAIEPAENKPSKPVTAAAVAPKQHTVVALNNTAQPVSGDATRRGEADLYADEIPLLDMSNKSGPGAFRIYLLSWSSRLDKNAGQLGLLGDVVEERSAGQYHYFTGKFATRAEAEKMLPELFNLGFRTAKIETLKTPAN